MKSSTKNEAKPAREVAYYRQRYKNRVFSKLISFINDVAQREQITKKDMADRLGKDPGQMSRLLNKPSNLTLDTISDLLLALNAEAEPPEIILFKDRRSPNFMHPLIARIVNHGEKLTVMSLSSPSNLQKQTGSAGNTIQLRMLAEVV